MIEKLEEMKAWTAQMNQSGLNFSNDLKQDFEDLYTSMMYENRFPPQFYPAGGDDPCSS